MTNEKRFVVGAEIRAEQSGDQMKIVARALTYGARSKRDVPAKGMYERCMPGCFKRSIDSSDDVKALLNHDQNFILGRRENQSLRLIDSKDALRFEIRLNPNVQFHRDTYNLVKDGTLNECSFAFACDADGDEYSQDKDERGKACVVRSIRSAKLFDVSIVANPAYGAGATSAEARSLAYEFTPEANAEDVQIAQRIARLGELVLADREAMLLDAENIVKAHRLGRSVALDEKRAEFLELKEELGI